MNNFHKHPIIYIKIFFYTFILAIITYFIINYFKDIKLLYFVFLIIWQFFLVFIYIEVLNIELDKFFLKDKKIFFLKKISILKREIIEIDFEKITEIKAIKKWILWDFFDYWNLTLVTNIWNFEFKNISNIKENSRNLLLLIKNK